MTVREEKITVGGIDLTAGRTVVVSGAAATFDPPTSTPTGPTVEEVESLAEKLHATTKAWLAAERNWVQPKWSSLREDAKDEFRETAESLIEDAEESMSIQREGYNGDGQFDV
jgi:hypothetical protein